MLTTTQAAHTAGIVYFGSKLGKKKVIRFISTDKLDEPEN
jgi:hypothetical protein